MSDNPNDAGRLHNKIAVVTGATSGIGEGIAHMFAREGASVLLHGLDAAGGERVIAEAVAAGVPRERLAFRAGDLGAVAECRALIAYAADIFGGLDILVNNAGDVARGFLDDTTVELWDRLMAVNLRAPFVLTQAAAPLMRARGGGAIVNIGSVNAYVGAPKLLAYSASKAGLVTFSRNVAQTLSQDNIRVNVVNVGWTLTQGEQRVMRDETGGDDWLEQAVATRPFGRLLLPQDIAHAVLFFASDASAMINGTVMDLEQKPIGAP
jgi:NAD(P)-dependent dehydrogenase (short-subunit alcohol dehydrogenase family)